MTPDKLVNVSESQLFSCKMGEGVRPPPSELLGKLNEIIKFEMLQLLPLPGGETKRIKGKRRQRKTKRKNVNLPFQPCPGRWTDSWLGCFLRFAERREQRRGAALVLAPGGATWRRCYLEKVTVGSWQSTSCRLSLILGAFMSTNRDLTLRPFPLLTSFPRSRAGFPWCSVSWGAQLFCYR